MQLVCWPLRYDRMWAVHKLRNYANYARGNQMSTILHKLIMYLVNLSMEGLEGLKIIKIMSTSFKNGPMVGNTYDSFLHFLLYKVLPSLLWTYYLRAEQSKLEQDYSRSYLYKMIVLLYVFWFQTTVDQTLKILDSVYSVG